MAEVNIDWWKATEIPLAETDWGNIRLYSGAQQSIDPFEWDRCVYIIRLSPPFAIHYEDDEKAEGKKRIVSPLIYVGSGLIKSRWSSHRKWLVELGNFIPGGRYEVWVCKPRVRNNDAAYQALEGYLLTRFKEESGFLPLRNLKIEGQDERHEYYEELYSEIIDSDRRYVWAIWPRHGYFNEIYNR